MSLNKVILVGHLGEDPDVGKTSNDQSFARFSIATNEVWNDKNGERQSRTEWHRIVTWFKLAEICGKYLTKGRLVAVEGRLQTRKWEDKDGNKRWTTEIVASDVQFLGSANQTRRDDAHAATPFPEQNFGKEPTFDTSEEMPF